MNLKNNQLVAITSALNYAYDEGKKFPGGISRKFNKTTIKEEIIPIIKETMSNESLMNGETPDLSLNELKIKIQEGETNDLSKIVSNKEKFDYIEYTCAKLNFNNNSIIDSENAPGNYDISIKGIKNQISVSVKIIKLEIVKNRKIKVKNDNFLFVHEFNKDIEININAGLNQLIKQANKLKLNKFYSVSCLCLRIVLEEALKTFIDKKGLDLHTGNKSKLENYLEKFKDFFVENSNNEITKFCENSNIAEYNKVKATIDNINPKEISESVNKIMHIAITYSNSSIEKNSRIISNILVIISESIK